MAIYMKRTTTKIVVRILELLSSIFHNASAAPFAWDVILAAFSAAFCVLLSLRCTSRIRPLIFAQSAQSQVLSLFFCGLGRRCRLLKISSLCCACLYFLLHSKAANRLRVAVPRFRHFWTSLNFMANKNKVDKVTTHDKNYLTSLLCPLRR